METSNPHMNKYPLTRLRGRSFTRLSPEKIEVFTLSHCAACEQPIALNCIIIPEDSDGRLMKEGLARAVKPSLGFQHGVHGDAFCSSCYKGGL